MYDASNDASYFILNDSVIDGCVEGRAYLDISAMGRRALAWVNNTTLYFVSETGIKSLGHGIEIAEISLDGRCCVYGYDGALLCYNADSDLTEVLAEDITAIRQVSISPNSKRVMFTIVREGGADETIIWDGSKTTAFDANATSLAISDDGSVIYYIDTLNGTFCVRENGNTTVISDSVSASSSYNFTNDIREVTYSDSTGKNFLYRLDGHISTELGTGFGYTEKTNAYSISTISLFTYINDVKSFTDGLWMERTRSTGDYEGYLYDIGYISLEGELEWLVQDAYEYEICRANNTILWHDGATLSRTDIYGNTHFVSANAVDFTVSSDGKVFYYITANGTLCMTKSNSSHASELDRNVSAVDTIGGVCVFVSGSNGKMYFCKDGDIELIMENVDDIDCRDGMMIAYVTNDEYGSEIFDAYVSTDGRTFSLVHTAVARG